MSGSVGDCVWYAPPLPLDAPLLNIHKLLPKHMQGAVLFTNNR